MTTIGATPQNIVQPTLRGILAGLGGNGGINPDFANVIYLFNGTGLVNGATAFTDLITTQSFSMNNGAEIDNDITPPVNADTFQFYDSSSNGFSDANQTSWRIGASEFCLEMWYYTTVAPQSSNGAIGGLWDGGGNFSYFLSHLAGGSNGNLSFFYSTTGANSVSFTEAWPTNEGAGVWRHIAMVRDVDTGYMYFNGVAAATTLDMTGVTMYEGTSSANNMQFGTRAFSFFLGGGVGPTRFTKGEPVYPGGITFDPPTEIFPTS